MSSRLDRLLESIDPVRTLNVVEARADEALNSFHMRTSRITHWQEFEKCMTSFFCHVERHLLRFKSTPDVDRVTTWFRCCQILAKEYGPQGEKAAFEIARTGAEDGLYGVLKAVARRLSKDYGGNEVCARAGMYWNELSLEEQFEAMEEYLEKYGHLLPSELTEASAARLRANFLKVLELHPHIIQRLHRIGR